MKLPTKLVEKYFCFFFFCSPFFFVNHFRKARRSTTNSENETNANIKENCRRVFPRYYMLGQQFCAPQNVIISTRNTCYLDPNLKGSICF